LAKQNFKTNSVVKLRKVLGYLTHNCNTLVFKNVKLKEKVRIHTNFF